MDPSDKNKVRELYERIDALDRKLAKASGRSERARIRQQVVDLREEAARALEPRVKQGRPIIGVEVLQLLGAGQKANPEP